MPTRVKASSWTHRHVRLLLATAWIVLAAISAGALLNAHQRGRAELEDRVGLRVELVANFVDSYAQDFHEQELRVAEQQLDGRTVARADFNRVVALFGLEAAILLNRRGELVHVTPANPGLIGSDLRGIYPHLDRALGGWPGVSTVTPAISGGAPVVAFAIPFATEAGQRRVFSGAFNIATSPLADYLGEGIAAAPNRVYLVDSAGAIIATNDSTAPMPEIPDAGLTTANAELVSSFHTAQGEFVAITAVPETPWRVAFVAPEATLYAPIDGFARWVPWLLWLGFAAGGLLSVMLVGRLLKGREELHRLARVDGLTGLANRTGIDEALRLALASARRHGHEVAVLLVDIDDFKQLNDTHGHAVGDEILRLVAGCLTAEARHDDVVGRWGGDEFLTVLTHTATVGPEAIGGRVHERVARTPLVIAGVPVSTTISVGFASSDGSDDVAEVLLQADKALYRAKNAGRNQIASAEQSPATTRQ